MNISIEDERKVEATLESHIGTMMKWKHFSKDIAFVNSVRQDRNSSHVRKFYSHCYSMRLIRANPIEIDFDLSKQTYQQTILKQNWRLSVVSIDFISEVS